MKKISQFTKSVCLLWLVSIVAVLPAVAASSLLVQADVNECSGCWVITATLNGGTNETYTFPGALYTVDVATDTLYGPFLEGQLGPPGGGLLDVAVTPDGSTAIVSNFGNSTVFFIDVSNPTNLHLLGSLNISFFAEDIAITSDGQFALVTDGGLASQLASIDIATRTLVEVEDLGGTDAQAVAVAPDGTVIVVDYLNGSLHTLTLDAFGYLTPAQDYYTPQFEKDGANITDWSVNVAVAPDDQTVLVSPAYADYLTIYQITGPGTLTYCGRVFGLPPIWDNVTKTWHGGQQSVAFSANGTQAYVFSNGIYDPVANVTYPNQISVLDITDPGCVSLRLSGAAFLMSNQSGQFFGVDVLARACHKLYVGNPTSFSAVNYLHVVDLTDFSVSSISVGPRPDAGVTGVAVLPRLFVGGDILPVNQGELLAPVLGLIAVTIVAVAALLWKGRVTNLRLPPASDSGR